MLTFDVKWQFHVKLKLAANMSRTSNSIFHIQIWSGERQNQQNNLCAQWRLRWAWASASLMRVFTVHLKKVWVLATNKATAKTLISLGGCSGWYKSLLGAQVISLVLLCAGSILFVQVCNTYHNMGKSINFIPYCSVTLSARAVAEDKGNPSLIISIVGVNRSFQGKRP